MLPLKIEIVFLYIIYYFICIYCEIFPPDFYFEIAISLCGSADVRVCVFFFCFFFTFFYNQIITIQIINK